MKHLMISTLLALAVSWPAFAIERIPDWRNADEAAKFINGRTRVVAAYVTQLNDLLHHRAELRDLGMMSVLEDDETQKLYERIQHDTLIIADKNTLIDGSLEFIEKLLKEADAKLGIAAQAPELLSIGAQNILKIMKTNDPDRKKLLIAFLKGDWTSAGQGPLPAMEKISHRFTLQTSKKKTQLNITPGQGIAVETLGGAIVAGEILGATLVVNEYDAAVVKIGIRTKMPRELRGESRYERLFEVSDFRLIKTYASAADALNSVESCEIILMPPKPLQDLDMSDNSPFEQLQFGANIAVPKKLRPHRHSLH